MPEDWEGPAFEKVMGALSCKVETNSHPTARVGAVWLQSRDGGSH